MDMDKFNSGLTLTAASYVIFVQPSLNPGYVLQAIGRACRIGQQKEVQVYRYIVQDSVEDAIVDIIDNLPNDDGQKVTRTKFKFDEVHYARLLKPHTRGRN